MISLQNIRFSYAEVQAPSDAVQDAGSQFDLRIPELQIQSGQLVAVTGRSGCGKTTLLNLLAGILLPKSGQVTVDGVAVSQLPDPQRRDFRLRRIGMVFQDFQLIDYLHVLDNVLLPWRLSGIGPPNLQIRDRATLLLQQTGLGQYLRKPVTRLSQGERQRVAICRAMLLQPSVLLADEPTGNLDPITADQILQLLLNQARQTSATLLVVTHDHSLLPAFDRILPFEFSGTPLGRSA